MSTVEAGISSRYIIVMVIFFAALVLLFSWFVCVDLFGTRRQHGGRVIVLKVSARWCCHWHWKGGDRHLVAKTAARAATLLIYS